MFVEAQIYYKHFTLNFRGEQWTQQQCNRTIMLGHSQRWKNKKRRVSFGVKNIKHPHLISKTILPKPPIETSSTSQTPEPQNLHRLPTSYPRNEPRQQSMNLPQKVSHLGRTTLYCSLHQPPTTIVSRSRDEE